MDKILFTSESVSEGHPDKLCDQISDAILDAIIKIDKNARVACETFITTQKVIVGGEIRTFAKVDYKQIVRNTLKEIGYLNKDIGIGYDTCDVEILIHEQSEDIALGVDENNDKEIGAGDQGIMFGYACDETATYMPLAITIAHDLTRTASQKRKSKEFEYSRPDMKAQVTIDYTDNTRKVDTVLMSIQHDEDYNKDEFHNYVKNMIDEVLKKYDVNKDNYKTIINPTGKFVIGGPHGDTGLTGRKIIVDTYGGYSRHGGGAFSGKDATKVDRSAAYAARYIAKNIVASKIAKKCEIQLSYAIGMSEPISIYVDTFNTSTVNSEDIIKVIRENFDLTPSGIIKMLKLDQPIYRQLASYGHFGNEYENIEWEKTNKTECFKNIK